MITKANEPLAAPVEHKRHSRALLLLLIPILGLPACCVLFFAYAWYTGCATFWAGPWVFNSPKPECAHLIQASDFMQAGDYQNAANHIAFELEKNPNNPDAYALRGDLNQRQGELDAAIADYSQAIRLNPGDATSLSARAYILARLDRDVEQAFADVNRALEILPGRGDYLDTRALVQYRRGKYQEAIRDAEQAIQKGELFGHYTLGLTYQALNEPARAIEHFSIFIRIMDPEIKSGQGQDARDRIVAMGGTLP